jgi:heme-degrading monooxygenase HmoA
MFVVLFEVQPKADRWDAYLGLAAWLRPELERIDGFIDNERFASQRTTGKLLSLSTWRDEKALIRWRTLAVHHGAQERGRTEIFADYHLRVGEVIADTQVHPVERSGTWEPSRALGQDRFDLTTAGPPLASIVEVQPGSTPGAGGALVDYDGAAGLVDAERYASITTPDPDKMLVLAAWRDEQALTAWQANRPRPSTMAPAATVRQRTVRVIRDYGLRDRYEAPQYYPPVEPGDHL